MVWLRVSQKTALGQQPALQPLQDGLGLPGHFQGGALTGWASWCWLLMGPVSVPRRPLHRDVSITCLGVTSPEQEPENESPRVSPFDDRALETWSTNATRSLCQASWGGCARGGRRPLGRKGSRRSCSQETAGERAGGAQAVTFQQTSRALTWLALCAVLGFGDESGIIWLLGSAEWKQAQTSRRESAKCHV